MHDIEVLEYWKTRSTRFPVLALIARDVLPLAAAGVGIERMFNSGRDICHYRRGRLNPETVRALMLQMCGDHFEIKNEFKDIQEQVTDELEEILAEESMEDDDFSADENAHISDDEEIDAIDDVAERVEDVNDEPELPRVQVQHREGLGGSSFRAQQRTKRRRAT